MTRYPLSSLADACGLSEHALCVRLGLSGSTMQEARHRGLSERLADRYAVRCGLPAAVVWPELIDAAIASIEKVCVAQDCEVRFVPSGVQRYCSQRCRQREKMRRYRATPHGAENNRKHRRNWYAQCAAYDNAVSRRRRERLKAS